MTRLMKRDSTKAFGLHGLSVGSAPIGIVTVPPATGACPLDAAEPAGWPALVHPHASAIDTPLPIPAERTHLMLGSKANWVPLHTGPRDQRFDRYPEESIAAWHKRLGLEC